jgi:predicted dehydrogenase
MAHRIGIVGLGVMGERMLRNMEKHSAFDVVAAWDPSPAARELLKAVRPTATFTDGPEALLRHAGLACLYIAAPPAHHLDYVRLAFDHDLAVFCEKPLAIDVAACRATVARAERERRVAAINFPFASAPAVRAIASGIKSGEFGAIERVDVEVAFQRWPRDWQAAAQWLAYREEGGFTREVLSHFAFLTARLVGPLHLEECRVDFPPDGRSAEMALSARLSAGGVPVTISGGVRGDVADLNRWILKGRHGAFELHDWYSLKRRINGGWLDIDFGEGSIRQRSYMAQLDALDAMLAKRPHLLPSFREGLAVQECIEAMLQSR